MKKLIFPVMLFVCSTAFCQDVYPSPRFCLKLVSGPLFTFNFHRPKKECKNGFGFCLRVNWDNWRWVPCDKVAEEQDEISLQKGMVRYSVWFDGKTAFIHLPIDLLKEEGFLDTDTDQFYIDYGDLVISDELSRSSWRLRPGGYPVIKENGRLIAAVGTEEITIHNPVE